VTWKIESGRMTDEEFDTEVAHLKKQEFHSNFNFLNDHKGLRTEELSLIIGPRGNGKSTLVRTIVCELLSDERRIYIFLSEESCSRYKMPIFNAFKIQTRCKDIDPNFYMENLFLESQINLDSESLEYNNFLRGLELKITELNLEVIIFDNFTTSFICSLQFKYQALAVAAFKRMAIEYGVVFLLVIHTGKGTNIYEKMIDGENVRGDATSVNIGSYNYMLTTFFRLQPPRAFLSVDKARYHTKSNKKVYELKFHEEVGLYVGDRQSSQDQVEAIINEIKKKTKKLRVDI